MSAARHGFDGERDVAAAGLPGNAASLGGQIVVIDVIDLALIVPGQDRADRWRAIRAIADHGFHRFIVGMAAEERHDVQVLPAKPQEKRLQQAGRQNDTRLTGAQALAL
jgi:hypothetical protein